MGPASEASALVGPFYVADDALEIADDARAQLKDDADKVLDAAIGALEGIDDTGTGVLGSESGWNAAAIEAALRDAIVDGLGIKPKFAFGPLRTAVSGQRVSPPLFESMEILGKTSTLTRLRRLHDELDRRLRSRFGSGSRGPVVSPLGSPSPRPRGPRQ